MAVVLALVAALFYVPGHRARAQVARGRGGRHRAGVLPLRLKPVSRGGRGSRAGAGLGVVVQACGAARPVWWWCSRCRPRRGVRPPAERRARRYASRRSRVGAATVRRPALRCSWSRPSPPAASTIPAGRPGSCPSSSAALSRRFSHWWLGGAGRPCARPCSRYAPGIIGASSRARMKSSGSVSTGGGCTCSVTAPLVPIAPCGWLSACAAPSRRRATTSARPGRSERHSRGSCGPIATSSAAALPRRRRVDRPGVQRRA